MAQGYHVRPKTIGLDAKAAGVVSWSGARASSSIAACRSGRRHPPIAIGLKTAAASPTSNTTS